MKNPLHDGHIAPFVLHTPDFFLYANDFVAVTLME